MHRWAPSSDSNNERAYAEALAKRCNVSPDQRLDLHDAVVLRRLGDAMARVEAGEDLPWSEDDKDTALKSVGMVVPPPPPEPAVARTPVASTPGRDQLVQDSHTLQGFINGAKQSDPELWHRLSDKPLAMSRTVWGSFLSMVVSWAVTRYGLDLDSDTCAVISGAIVLAVTGVIRRYSVGGVSGILKATPANPP